ncbi:MAG: hypothetical protein KF833_14350 [Verrucomicrobiae bacterium]|nr:hypothetical protein [Verrucomicrobiae bacterium]
MTTVAAGVLAFLLAGCHSVEVTKPKRTMAEQLLLSTAADRSVEGVDLSVLREKRVFVDDRYFDSVDKPYVIGTIRELISTNGAYLVSSVDRADIVVEPRSGALGIDTRETLFGVPSIPFPIPFAGTVTTPEISIFKSEKADSLGKFALLAYERESGDHVHSSGSMVGVAQFHYYRVLSLIHWRQTDIPELDPRVWRRLRQAALTAGGEEAPE